MAFLIFRTKKEDDKSTEFRGQTSNIDLKTVSSAAKRTTDEPVTHVRKGEGDATATTETYHVDFLPKSDLQGTPPNKFMYGQIPE